MIDAADDVRDAHVVVVDDDGMIVDGRAVAAQDDHVVEVGVLPHDAALYPVLDHGLAVERGLEADHRLRRRAGASLGSRSRQGLWIVCGPFGGRFSFFASSRSADIASRIASISACER